MIAMLLGLIVVAAAGGMLVSGQQLFRTSTALGDVQDSARMAFDMLARDIRSAGMTGCGNGRRVANVLNASTGNGGVAWWNNWDNVIHGYAGNDPDVAAGSSEGARVPGTPSVQLLGGEDTGYSVASHDSSKATFTLVEASTDYTAGDAFIVCDFDHAAVFKSSSVGTRTIGYAGPGDNCSLALGYSASCSSANTYTFGANAQITRLNVADWYIGKNPDGGTSLYRLGRAGNTLSRQEMVRGIGALALSYRQDGLAEAFVGADKVTDWTRVKAVRIRLSVQSADARAAADGGAVARTLLATVALRNRMM